MLDVAIGLSLIYLGGSLFVSILNETIAGLLRARSKELKRNLEELLDDRVIKKAVFESRVFQDAKDRFRSYADPVALAQVILGALGTKADPTAAARGSGTEAFLRAIEGLEGSSLKTALVGMARASGDKIERLSQELGTWLDRSLTLMGEGYKRWIQTLSFGLGLVLAVALNIDSLSVVDRLFRDKEVRDLLTAAGEHYVTSISAEAQQRCQSLPKDQRAATKECEPMLKLTETLVSRTGDLGKLPIGWNSVSASGAPDAQPVRTWGLRIVGWLITALALMLGAPFWFDVLNRVVNLRSGSKRPLAGPST